MNYILTVASNTMRVNCILVQDVTISHDGQQAGTDEEYTVLDNYVMECDKHRMNNEFISISKLLKRLGSLYLSVLMVAIEDYNVFLPTIIDTFIQHWLLCFNIGYTM